MATTTLPNHASDLYPPCPRCDVTATDDAFRRVQLAMAPLVAHRDQRKARLHAASLELPDLFAAGKPTDALLEELADIAVELSRLDVKITALDRASVDLMQRRYGLERTDPVYRSWTVRCSQIDHRWGDAMSRLPSLSDGASAEQIASARRSALFGIVASVQADHDDHDRSTRDQGRLIGRGRR